MQPGEKPLWVAKVHFILLLLVITTLIISWFNLNSYFIILSMAFLFVTERIVVKLKEIFSNKLFLCYFALALVELAGMLYTDNARIGWKNVEAKATLVAIPFILLVGPFRGKTNYKKIMTGYCLLLFVISLICLCLALTRYIDTGDPYVLFYHDLVDPIAQNAIVFTLFVLAAMLYLLSSNLYFGENVTVHRRWRI